MVKCQSLASGVRTAGKYFQGSLIERLRMVWTYGFTGHFIIHNPEGGHLTLHMQEGVIRHLVEVRGGSGDAVEVANPESRILEALSWKKAANEWVHHAPPTAETLSLDPKGIIEVVERLESRRETQRWGYETCKLTSRGKGFHLPMTFEFTFPNGEVSEMAVDKETTVIGRGQTCDVQLETESISREHAFLRVTREGLAIQDNGSTNRVRLNGEVLPPGVFFPFEIGDILWVGEVQMRVAQDDRRLHAGRQVKAREDLRLMKRKPCFLELPAAVEAPVHVPEAPPGTEG
jgi:hypothetical protein